MDDLTGVGAVVVTRNPDLRRFALSLSQIVNQARRVVVVDNGSRRLDELDLLIRSYPSVVLVPLGQNRGIAAGFNVGIGELARDGQLPPWVLTLDQDSVLHSGAIEAMFCSLDKLDEVTRLKFGIICAGWIPPAFRTTLEGRNTTRWLWHRVESDLDRGRIGEFRCRHSVVSSGNLIRREVLESVAFRDELFIDHVDTAFCADVRRHSWLVAETEELLMDHRIGEQMEHRGHSRSYENAQRLYYITRNSTYLVLRGSIPLSAHLVATISWFRTYFMKHGRKAAIPCSLILVVGVFDGLFRRLGQREYRFVTRECNRSAPD